MKSSSELTGCLVIIQPMQVVIEALFKVYTKFILRAAKAARNAVRMRSSMEANWSHKFIITAVLCIINKNKIIKLVSITNLFENLLRLFEAFYGTLKPSHARASNSQTRFSNK